MLLRPLQAADNAAMAAVIRSVSAEFGLAPSQGFAVADATLDDLHAVYGHEAAAYWVVENDAGVSLRQHLRLQDAVILPGVKVKSSRYHCNRLYSRK